MFHLFHDLFLTTGEFGLVYKGTWSLKNIKVAVKTLRGGATDEQKRNFLFEASGLLNMLLLIMFTQLDGTWI